MSSRILMATVAAIALAMPAAAQNQDSHSRRRSRRPPSSWKRPRRVWTSRAKGPLPRVSRPRNRR